MLCRNIDDIFVIWIKKKSCDKAMQILSRLCPHELYIFFAMPSAIMSIYEWMFVLFSIPAMLVYRLFFPTIVKLRYLILYIRTMKHRWLLYMEGLSFIIYFVMHNIKTREVITLNCRAITKHCGLFPRYKLYFT